MAVAVLLLLVQAQSALANPQEFTLSRGQIPILLVAPHGGSQQLMGATVREKEKVSDPHFTTKRDMLTVELAKEIADKFPAGQKPSVLISQVHRQYVDHNRKELLSSHHPKGRLAHRRFHNALRAELSRLKKKHKKVLLIDIHGQSSQKVDVTVGTREGKTISPWSEDLLWSENGLLSQLKKAGFTIQPDYPEQRTKYNGGFIVKEYGFDPKVDAWQIEHGKELRFSPEMVQKYVAILAPLLAERSKSLIEQKAPTL